MENRYSFITKDAGKYPTTYNSTIIVNDANVKINVNMSNRYRTKNMFNIISKKDIAWIKRGIRLTPQFWGTVNSVIVIVTTIIMVYMVIKEVGSENVEPLGMVIGCFIYVLYWLSLIMKVIVIKQKDGITWIIPWRYCFNLGKYQDEEKAMDMMMFQIMYIKDNNIQNNNCTDPNIKTNINSDSNIDNY